MNKKLWSEHLGRLRESLLAQAQRSRSVPQHTAIKGASIEVVLRRTLREYLPADFAVGTGQIANNAGSLSPQVDVIVYDQHSFPHLAVNEDSSVVVCAESVLVAVECKASWKASSVVSHFAGFCDIVRHRYDVHAGINTEPAYLVFLIDDATPKIEALADPSRLVGVYALEGNRSWVSPVDTKDFTERFGNPFEQFLQDALRDCMRKGRHEIGTLEMSYKVLATYLGWPESAEGEQTGR